MPRDRADVRLDVSVGEPAASRGPGADTMRGGARAVAIVGDLSGRDGRPPEPDDVPLAERRMIPIDRDVLGDVLADLAPRTVVDLGIAGAAPFELRFTSLDDFHPDRLLDRVPLLAALEGGTPPTERKPRDAPAADAPSPGGLLDRILDATPDTRMAAATAGDDLSAFVARVVARHVVHEPGAAERTAARERDEMRTRVLRAVLRADGVRRLESVWRALDALVRRVETDEDLRLYVLDVSRRDLSADLAARPRVEDSGLGKLLGHAARLPTGMRWGMFVGLYTFGIEDDDLAVVTRLGAAGRAAGAGWLAGARPWGDGWPDLDEREAWAWTSGEAWTRARRGPDAGWIGLALPGFLLRPPYGAAGEPCGQLAFEELADPREADAYLWGHPAVACAAAILGSDRRAGPVVLDSLPVHAVRDASGEVFQGCVEVAFTEDQADRLLDAGLVPLVSPRGTDRLLVRGLRAIVEPPGALPGWGSR